MTGRFTLPKSHILRSKTEIDALVERGAVLFRYPIKVYYLEREGFSRIMVSVPKRNFKRAVKRNLLKRRIREAWRLNAGILEGMNAGDLDGTAAAADTAASRRPCYDLLFVYLGREIESYERIEATLTGLLRQLAEK